MLFGIYLMLGALAVSLTPAIVCNLNDYGSCLGANGLALIFGPLCLVCLVAAVAVHRDEKAKQSRGSAPDASLARSACAQFSPGNNALGGCFCCQPAPASTVHSAQYRVQCCCRRRNPDCGAYCRLRRTPLSNGEMLAMLLISLLVLVLAVAPAIACNLIDYRTCFAYNGMAMIFGFLGLLCLLLTAGAYYEQKARKQRASEADGG